MRLHFIGTCAGTEPMPARRHACVVLECKDKLYWFDAGESCSQTGHLMGLDLLKIKNIIVSHPHTDHIGGLVNLLWTIRKLAIMQDRLPEGDINLYTPEPKTTEGVFMILESGESGFKTSFNINRYDVNDGILFDDSDVKVTAYHNEHMKSTGSKKWISYSYRIEAEGKRVVYSGDVKAYTELDKAIGDCCDALIVETGHFGIDDVYDYVKNKNIGKILFSHNGREIINFPKESMDKAEYYFGSRGIICEDKMTIDV